MSGATPSAAYRLARGAYNLAARRGFVPKSMPDLVEDRDLAGTSLPETVMVYFPDTRESLYQIRQWYGPFRALHERHPLVVVLKDSRTARIIASESGLRCVTVARYGTVDDLLSRSAVKLALYVNHHAENFANLRFLSLVHVHLSHGDSDKGVNVSNQIKGYDYNFVAGQAAVDRIDRSLMLYDIARTIPIGRPQLDFADAVAPARSDARTAVLYAPTWEGAQPSMNYTSVATHGEAMVNALLRKGSYRVVYRPHPLTGVGDPAVRAADVRLRELVTNAGHEVDLDSPLPTATARSDVLICDISGVAVDYLASGKPLIVTTPASPHAIVAQTRMLEVTPRLPAADASGVADLVATLLVDEDQRARREALVDYYLGDTTHGVATRRFVEACEHVMTIRDAAWSAVLARGPAGP